MIAAIIFVTKFTVTIFAALWTITSIPGSTTR